MSATRRSSIRPAGAGRVDVYVGQQHIGEVEPDAGGYVARCPRGRSLGKFPSHRDAVRELVRHAKERGAS